MADWQQLSIQLPGKDLLEPVRSALETLLVFLEVLKTILETVKIFLVDFGNPIKALVQSLIGLILEVFETLKATGLFGYYDIPQPLIDPNFQFQAGGFQAFIGRFKASLVDPRDPNRPQPRAGSTQGGFTIIVADAEGPTQLVRLIRILLKFFGKEFLNPQYAAPANVKVLPLGDNGDPILSVVKLFEEQPKSVVVSWSLPPTGRPGEPGFFDLAGVVSTQFVPPKFLIEKSTVDVNQEIDVADLGDSEAAGIVTAIVDTPFEYRGIPGDTIKRKVRLFDDYGDPFIKFQEYIEIDVANATTTFLLGQLGTFRYIDEDVEEGKTYYYRVRAYSGDLDISGGSVAFADPENNIIDQQPTIVWPGDDPVMGRASPVIRARIPEFPTEFDVIETLKRLFQTAYSLNLHLPQDPKAEFDDDGKPIAPTEPSAVGLGTMVDFAGPLSSFQAIPLVGSAVSDFLAPDPVTGRAGQLPWQIRAVQRNSARLATIIAGTLLEAGGAQGFKDFMERPLPHGIGGSDPQNTTLAGQTTLKDLVYKITEVQEPGKPEGYDAAIVYADADMDVTTRLNVVAGVNYVKSFTLGGTKPDWVAISVFKDIVPWSGQLLYEMLAKMQALLDAYSGVISEIQAFINLLVRKIDTLEAFIKYLISILNFIESLEAGFYVLSVPSTGGDASEWIQLIDSAGGDRPPSGPGGFSAGVALAYVAPDITAFEAAFNLIF